MKNKSNLIIFQASGNTRTIPLDLLWLSKTCALLVALFVLSGSGITLYNYYNLALVKNSFDRTMKNQDVEKRNVMQRLSSLENFEEKISFFLGGALTGGDGSSIPINNKYFPGGMGGGEDSETSEPANINVPAEPTVEEEPSAPVQISADPEGLNVETRIGELKLRLEDLATLAEKEKTRLDLTPSIFPAQGYITSQFGWRRSPFTGGRHLHRGIDLVNKVGTPVKSTAAGTVIFAGKEVFWGNAIYIQHLNGIVTKYGHLSSFNITLGQKVHRGDVIGYIGMTGRTTGPHVHYQIEINGEAVDPMQFVIEERDID